MAAEEVRREYSLTDPELCMFTSNLVGDMTRDITEFGTFGVDAADVTAMQTLGNEFEVFPSDEMYEGDVITATDAKNSLAEDVKEGIRNLAIRVEMKWGADAGNYKRLGIKGMNNFTDLALLYYARRVHLCLTEYLADLASEGLTQAMLDAFEDLCLSYETALNTQHDKINLRDTKRVERVRKGNSLYVLVSKYCELGKRIWFKVDPAKYDDYIIYPGGVAPGAPDAPANLAWDVETDTFSWDAVPDATSYQLLYKEPSDTEWLEAYAGTDVSAVFDPGHGQWEFRVRARNSAGYGNFCVAITILVPGGLEAPQNVVVAYFPDPSDYLQLSWDAVFGASSYKLYQCIVPVGQPSGNFMSPETPVSSPYVVNNPSVGMRYYYNVCAVASGEISEHSATVYADVTE